MIQARAHSQDSPAISHPTTTLAVKGRSGASALRNGHSDRLGFLQHLAQAFLPDPWQARKGKWMFRSHQSLRKTSYGAEPGFAWAGREMGTRAGQKQFLEAKSSQGCSLAWGHSQCFTRASQRKAAHFRPAYCAFLPLSPQSSRSTHLFRVPCLPPSTALTESCFLLLCVKVCRRKVVLSLLHSRHIHRNWFHNPIKDKLTWLSLKSINTQSKHLREFLIKMQYQLILSVILPLIAPRNHNKKIPICYQLASWLTIYITVQQGFNLFNNIQFSWICGWQTRTHTKTFRSFWQLFVKINPLPFTSSAWKIPTPGFNPQMSPPYLAKPKK